MRRHLSNAIYGVLDYVSYPLGMLIAAPIVLRRLGAAEYGLWMIATAVVSTGGIVASGFCDAGIQRVARLRADSDAKSIVGVVRGLLGVHCLLGVLLGGLAWIVAPHAARHVAVSSALSSAECRESLRIAGVLVLARAVESAAVSAHRAFERYRTTVQISTAMRLLTLACAVALALLGYRTPGILVGTGLFLVLGGWMQFRHLRAVLGDVALYPSFRARDTREILHGGIFVWLQTAGSVVAGQLDRILLGFYLGAAAVAPYALCVQCAQPVFAMTASALHFLFPYFSVRGGMLTDAELRKRVLLASFCNLLLVFSLAGLLIVSGERLLRLLAGPVVAHTAVPILEPIVIGSALSGLSVTGTYAAQALGLFRPVAFLSLGGRAAMLLLLVYALRAAGPRGLAEVRVCSGLLALLVYVPLWQKLHRASRSRVSAYEVTHTARLQEDPLP